LTDLGYTHNTNHESGLSETVHGWCRGYPFGNRRGSHSTYQWRFWCRG